MIDPKTIDKIEVFLALSMLLEFESADRLRELAICMRNEHAEELTLLLEQLAEFSDVHASEIQELSEGHVLPDLATMGVSWEGLEGPETTVYESISPTMNPYDVLQIALRNEIKGQDFYTSISLNSPNEDVRKMAADFADEENSHVMLIEQWIANYEQQQ